MRKKSVTKCSISHFQKQLSFHLQNKELCMVCIDTITTVRKTNTILSRRFHNMSNKDFKKPLSDGNLSSNNIIISGTQMNNI